MTIYTQANPGVFLPHMPDVARCELSLRELNQMWRLIESSAKMNCPAEARLLLPAMVATRTGFAHLEQALVANLVQEKVRHVLAELGTQARYAIDILVRNLYERTADVGFLAADADLCRFVAGLADDQDAARRRLHDYRDKYTVYDEILLLDLDGRVLVQADPTLPLTHSRDPLLQQTLDTPGYLETFRATDLRPGKPRALVYSQRMLHPDSGAPVGVLCLCFNFDDEMAAIFAAYRDPSQRANMLLLDAQDRVISSADPLWIPAGVRVPTNTAGQPQLLLFGGREYLVRTFGAAGYQGYAGPAGWKTQLMVPVDLAFRAGGEQALAAVAPALMQGLLSHAQAFSPALHELMGSVTRTTRTIERIVWNGKVTGAAHERGQGQGQDHADTGQRDGVNKLNTVLDQITETGQRSDALFSHSIQDLYQTVLASSLSEASLTAQLLVDLLDRNLYERANDCRWWAQSAQLRRGLAWPSAAESAAIGAVLAHINRLYTVYARLFVYDRDGRIVASTGNDTLVGQQLDGDTLARVTALRSAQAHHPQAFGPSPFYGGDATYVYHAAIRHPEQDTVVGGIGVVFDARPELRNMLHSGVAGRAHLRAYFVTPDGRVLSSSDADCDAGDLLQLDGGLLAAAAEGDSGAASRILQHDGQYVIAACARAAGYREFRAVDGVEQPVLAVLLQAFGPVRGAPPAPAPRIERLRDSGPDFAIFYAGGTLMALRAAHVQEALPFARVQRTPSGDSGGGGSAGAGGSSGGSGGAGDSGSGSARQARIGMLDVAPAGGRAHCVWVFDLALLAGGRAAAISEHSQVMLVRHGVTLLGLLVDDLHSVQQFDAADLSASPLAVGDAALAPRLIKANDGQLLIQELDLERLLARLRT